TSTARTARTSTARTAGTAAAGTAGATGCLRRRHELGQVRRIRVGVRDVHAEHTAAPALLLDRARHHDAGDLAIAAVNLSDVEVAHEGVFDPGLDDRDEIVVVDVTVDGVAHARRRGLRLGRAPAEPAVLDAVELGRGQRRAVLLGALEEAPR